MWTCFNTHFYYFIMNFSFGAVSLNDNNIPSNRHSSTFTLFNFLPYFPTLFFRSIDPTADGIGLEHPQNANLPQTKNTTNANEQDSTDSTEISVTSTTLTELGIEDNPIALSEPELEYFSFKNHLSQDGRPIELHYCSDLKSAEEAIQFLLGQPMLGFDAEFAPWPKGNSGPAPVALIQIASPDHIVLFHVWKSERDNETNEFLIPNSLRAVMEDDNVLKIGVQISGDGSHCQTHLGTEMKGLFELNDTNNVLLDNNVLPQIPTNEQRHVSLEKLVRHYLHARVFGKDKGEVRKESIQMSDWTGDLSEEQIEYAANDAYISLALLLKMEALRMGLAPIPDRPASKISIPWQLREHGESVVSPSYTYPPELTPEEKKGAQMYNRLALLDPDTQNLYHELCVLRHKMMVERNLTSERKYYVADNEKVLKMAKKKPVSLEEWYAYKIKAAVKEPKKPEDAEKVARIAARDRSEAERFTALIRHFQECLSLD
ncbi:ribonuclease H-like protein [Tothia fuscella]|uniref:Ribonuclease H-like protein n=1 Tax=Tothia fuscella TaxID=1048955 RepID=A0A9P4NSJ4_9PEZI|nr:ribonuclease H-like protein [Tothia fuscella]